MTRTCRTCGIEKPLSEFYGNGVYRRTECKNCNNRHRDSQPDSKRRQVRRYLRRYYGLTPDEYLMLLQAQNHACAICGKEWYPGDTPRNMAVDHDHATGKVRGLLCDNCNLGLGNFQDSPELLEKAIRYLREGGTNI